jgi:hypothetical protein
MHWLLVGAERMGAETTVYCKVLVAEERWIEVSAITLQEAMSKAEAQPGVIRCIEASYEPGGVVT